MINRIKIIVNEEIKKYIINETNRIQRLKDSDYPYPQLQNVDFSHLKDVDDEYNAKNPGANVDSQKPLHTPVKGSIPNAELEKYKKELTKNIQKRAKEKTGSDSIPIKDINASDNVKKKLEKSGLKLEVKGDVFVYGNKKLPADTMIVNLTSAFNCPSLHCPLRNSVCYAKRDERLYSNTELRNLRNEFALEQMSVKEILKLVDLYIKAAPCRIRNIRLSEDGDFKSQEVVDFCDKLAGHLYAKYGIKTTCYTHQRFDFTKCKNLIVNSSMRGEAIKGADRNFIVLLNDRDKKGRNTGNNPRFDSLIGDGKIHQIVGRNGKVEYYFKCNGSCKKCGFCYNTKEENGEPKDARVNVYEKEH